jgi:hypothetical protein
MFTLVSMTGQSCRNHMPPQTRTSSTVTAKQI